jgi:hypothetical protein
VAEPNRRDEEKGKGVEKMEDRERFPHSHCKYPGCYDDLCVPFTLLFQVYPLQTRSALEIGAFIETLRKVRRQDSHRAPPSQSMAGRKSIFDARLPHSILEVLHVRPNPGGD